MLGLAGALWAEAPSELRVNDLVEPVGLDAHVFYGWRVNSSLRGERPSGYQVIVASTAERLVAEQGDVWDSERVWSTDQNHVRHAGAALASDTRYFWKVRTWDQQGRASPWSAPSAFTVGLLQNDDWAGAEWIRRATEEADDYTRYRRRFELPTAQIVRATLYISVVHRYALYLNGSLVGKGHAYHHPEYQYYQAHDVTALLRSGEINQLAVFTHWFGGGQGRPASQRGLLLKLIVHHADGTQTVVSTDHAWRQSPAAAWAVPEPVHRNAGEGVGYIEQIDGRALDPHWPLREYDDSNWALAAVIGPHPTAPWLGRLSPDLVRVEETVIRPVRVVAKPNRKYVVDLGKVYAGTPRIEFAAGEPGEVVTMRGGYVLDAQGEIPPGTGAQDTKMDYRAVLSGRPFTYEPVEYLGLRYFQIDQAPMRVTVENFAFVVRHAPLAAAAASFDSPNPMLNRVWGLMKHSLSTCAMENFVDTPTREKGGFLADAAIQSAAGMEVFHERVLTRRVLAEFIQSMDQHWAAPADRGRMNAVYPNEDGARDIPDFTQSYLDWVRDYYLHTGDRAFLEQNATHLADIGDYLVRHLDVKTGLVTQLTGGRGPYEHGIIDWPARMRYGYDMAATARTVINARAYAAFDTLAYVAAELGRPAEREDWRRRAEDLRAAINRRLRTAEGLYHDGLRGDGTPSPHVSQHANMFPLALGLVPPDAHDRVAAYVVRQRMSVGMVTVAWLVRALGENDQGSALLDLLTNPEQPGWARTVTLGGTATWESWDADQNNDSLSHAWGAGGLHAYTRYILGIRLLRPQAEKVRIQPLDFGDKLPWAKGHLTTDRGPITVEWRRSATAYELTVDVPGNVSAEIVIPAGTGTPSVQHNGTPVATTVEGGRIMISAVGSGRHVVVRQSRP